VASIIPATIGHVEELSGKLRVQDERECQAGYGISASTGLLLSFLASKAAWAIICRDRAVGMGGVCEISEGMGAPWFLATADIRYAARFVAQVSRPYVEKMLELYPILVNRIHARNIRAVRWLRWIGFTIQPAKPWGVSGELFHEFSRCRVCV
jgi:hypothetical protein